jgi:putative ABC transport system permease protein
VDSVLKDIRFALRTLRKSPGFAAIAILALGLGIGSNTAIFSIADAFLLKPIQLPDAAHLYVVLEQAPHQTTDTVSVAPANFRDWQDQTKSFDQLGAWRYDAVNLTGVGLPDRVQGFLVSANFFNVCGAKPLYGRDFLSGEDRPGNDNVVVISQGLWQRRLGGSPNIIGQAIHLDGKPYTVVGIMPRSFNFPMTAELWLPLALSPKDWQSRSVHDLFALARLKHDVTLANANAEMAAITKRLSDAYPSTNKNWRARVIPINVFTVGDDTRAYTFLLLGAVGFVLLIVCANVANLQFVRGASRQREIAIRAALGGSRWRLIRQLITESILLGIGGAIIGLLFGKWAISLIVGNMPADVAKYIAHWYEIGLDTRALLFTIFVAVFAGIIAGLLPALETSRADVNAILKEGGRSGSAGGRHFLRNLLVVTQVASAIVLLVGAGLIVRGFRSLLKLNQGSQPETILTMSMDVPATRYNNPQKLAEFYDQVLDRLNAIPGVTSAAAASAYPYSNEEHTPYFTIEGRPWRDASEMHYVAALTVSPNYLKLLRTPLVRGRELSDSDSANSAGVVMISQSMARDYWHNDDPIGHRIKLGGNDSTNPWMTIVGVVSDVKMDWSENGPPYAVYRPYRQAATHFTSFLIRTAGDPMNIAPAARLAVASVDPDQPIYDMKPYDQVIQESVIGLAYVAVMMGALGMMALVLAAVGVYGVMAFLVQQRTHEIGIRMALGARTGDVLRLVIGGGLWMTLIGLAVGVPIAYLFARLMAGLIYGIGATDPATFIGCGFVLVCVAAAACFIPARRATSVDPMIALRHE